MDLSAADAGREESVGGEKGGRGGIGKTSPGASRGGECGLLRRFERTKEHMHAFILH